MPIGIFLRAESLYPPLKLKPVSSLKFKGVTVQGTNPPESSILTMWAFVLGLANVGVPPQLT